MKAYPHMTMEERHELLKKDGNRDAINRTFGMDPEAFISKPEEKQRELLATMSPLQAFGLGYYLGVNELP